MFLDLRKSFSFEGNITIEFPRYFVQDSQEVEVTAVGDILGTIMVNLERLIFLPTSGGEQNLIEFVPNLIILNYLRSTRQLTPTVEKEAIENLETAYQNQLNYRKPDGGFTAFGKKDEIGSTW